MTTPCDSRTSAPAGVCVALRRLPRGLWLAGCLLVLGGCVEPAYYGGSPYYEERNSYYESRPVYVQPNGYGGSPYYGSSYYRPAPRVDVYYYNRGRDYDRHDHARDWRGHDDGRRGDDRGWRGHDDNRRGDDRGWRGRDDGRRDEHRADPPVARAPQPSGGGDRRDVKWARPAPGTPEAQGRNGWVPRPYHPE